MEIKKVESEQNSKENNRKSAGDSDLGMNKKQNQKIDPAAGMAENQATPEKLGEVSVQEQGIARENTNNVPIPEKPKIRWNGVFFYGLAFIISAITIFVLFGAGSMGYMALNIGVLILVIVSQFVVFLIFSYKTDKRIIASGNLQGNNTQVRMIDGFYYAATLLIVILAITAPIYRIIYIYYEIYFLLALLIVAQVIFFFRTYNQTDKEVIEKANENELPEKKPEIRWKGSLAFVFVLITLGSYFFGTGSILIDEYLIFTFLIVFLPITIFLLSSYQTDKKILNNKFSYKWLRQYNIKIFIFIAIAVIFIPGVFIFIDLMFGEGYSTMAIPGVMLLSVVIPSISILVASLIPSLIIYKKSRSGENKEKLHGNGINYN